jgi:hypothetical protein
MSRFVGTATRNQRDLVSLELVGQCLEQEAGAGDTCPQERAEE